MQAFLPERPPRHKAMKFWTSKRIWIAVALALAVVIVISVIPRIKIVWSVSSGSASDK
jgi:hypothetical protein